MKILFVTLLCAAVVSSPVAALAAAEPIDEILVLVKRRPASLSEMSSAVTIVDVEPAAPTALVTDAIADQPGLFLQQTTPGQGAVIIRGLKGSSVLHLVDGMRLNNAIFRSAPTQYLALIPSIAVERIEVVRGAAASLYGSDAVAGVVQVVSRTPQFSGTNWQSSGHATLSLDTANLRRSVSAVIDSGHDSFAASGGLELQSLGNRRAGDGARIDSTAFDSQGAYLHMAGTPTSGERWRFDVHYLRQPDTPRSDELNPGFGQQDPSSAEFRFAPNQRLFAHAEYARDNAAFGLDWSIDAGWQQIIDDRVSRNFGSVERRHEANRSDLFGVTLDASRSSESFAWIAGAELYYDVVNSSRREFNRQTETSLQLAPRFPDGSSILQIGLYVSADWQPAPRHTLTTGIRFSANRVELAATDGSAAGDIDVNDWSGDLGWVFDASDTLQWVANLGYGFRAPNIFDLGTLGNRPGNRFNIPNPDLDSESAVHGDVGVRFSGNRLTLELLVFGLNYDERIVSVLTGEQTAAGRDIVQSVNAASASLRGIELKAEYALSDRVSAELVLNQARGDQRSVGSDQEPADRMPPTNGKLLLSIDAVHGWRFDQWVRFASRQDRLSARDLGDTRINPQGTAGWLAFGVGAHWDDRHRWALSLSIENLFDRRYRLHGSGIDAAGRNAVLHVQRRF